MDDCNYVNKQNCLKGYNCPTGYECCSERDNTANVKPTFGHCVQKNTCDFSRGICKSKKPRKFIEENFDEIAMENFRENFRENFQEDYMEKSEKNCKHELKEWKNAFWFMFIFVIIVIAVCVSCKMRL